MTHALVFAAVAACVFAARRLYRKARSEPDHDARAVLLVAAAFFATVAGAVSVAAVAVTLLASCSAP